MRRLPVWILCMSFALALAAPMNHAGAQTDASFNLRIGDRYRGPDLGFYGEPNTVAVPGRAGVYYVQDSNNDVYRYNNYWYMNYNGDWYRASDYRGPFVFVGYRSVPRDVYTVPSQYRTTWTDYRDMHYDWNRPDTYGNTTTYSYSNDNRASLRIGDPYRGPDLGFYDEPQTYSVSGRPGLYYVRDSSNDVYRYNNYWYMNYNGNWYRAGSYRGPWRFVGYQSVPRVVYTVPTQYRRTWRDYRDRDYTYNNDTRYYDNGNNRHRMRYGALRIGARYNFPMLRFTDQPSLIRVPGSRIYYVEDSDYDVYRAGNYWYLNYNGDWYQASSYRGPWTFVGYRSVPREVYMVPTQYRRHWSDYRDRNYNWNSSSTTYGTTGNYMLTIGQRYNGPDLGFYSEPELVSVPGRRGVYYVNDSSNDVYLYDNTWYMNYNGDWYRASSYRGPFVFVGYRGVPRSVYTVPTNYRRTWTNYQDTHYDWNDSQD